jgi:hypothetical protein
MRREGGSSTKIVPAENTPSASQIKKKKTQIVPRLRTSPAARIFDNELSPDFLTSDFSTSDF